MSVSLSGRLEQILVEHSKRYPQMQVQDLYKLLYQATMGSGHAVPDVDQAQICLEHELRLVVPDANQPLIEQISPEGRHERKVVRINLRAYIYATHNWDLLLEAFVRTANEFKGSVQRLERYIFLVELLPSLADMLFSKEDFEGYMSKMYDQNYPAIHHSQSYSTLYQPAYRLVAQEFLGPIINLVDLIK